MAHSYLSMLGKKLVRDKINETSRRELLPLNHCVVLQEYTLSCTSLIYCGLSVKNFHDIGDKYRFGMLLVENGFHCVQNAGKGQMH